MKNYLLPTLGTCALSSTGPAPALWAGLWARAPPSTPLATEVDMVQVKPDGADLRTRHAITGKEKTCVSQGCSKKGPQTECLKNQKCIISQFWGLDVKNQVVLESTRQGSVRPLSRLLVVPWFMAAKLNLCDILPVCKSISVSVAHLSLTLCGPMNYSPRLFCSWSFAGENTGVGCHFLLQGIFPT